MSTPKLPLPCLMSGSRRAARHREPNFFPMRLRSWPTSAPRPRRCWPAPRATSCPPTSSPPPAEIRAGPFGRRPLPRRPPARTPRAGKNPDPGGTLSRTRAGAQSLPSGCEASRFAWTPQSLWVHVHGTLLVPQLGRDGRELSESVPEARFEGGRVGATHRRKALALGGFHPPYERGSRPFWDRLLSVHLTAW